MASKECAHVSLVSKDLDIFHVDREVACRSITLKNVFGDTGMDAPVPLPMVSSTTLVRVIEYCQFHHQSDADNLPEQSVAKWDEDFLKVDDEELFALILAANYLELKPLLDLTCKSVADQIKGKTPEQIRARFNIKNDFTPEEEAEVQRENAWCEER